MQPPLGVPLARDTDRRLLAVVAHPDDETFGCGGLLAKYAAEGVYVAVACATRGEVGEIGDPSLATPESLGEVREKELREACRALGVREVHLLGYRDSGMPGSPHNSHPQSLHQAPLDSVVGLIVGIVRRVRPQVVVTFDPKGEYGHPDHIAINRATYEAFKAAGDPSRYPQKSGVRPASYTPKRLYYFTFPRSAVYAFQAAYRESGIESELDDIDPETMGTPDDEVTTIIDVDKYRATKEAAAGCHRTQNHGADPFGWVPEPLRSSFLSREHLVRAEPPLPAGATKENDLFTGL